eukprot:7265824-Pyramimonas_sp.AAC.1
MLASNVSNSCDSADVHAPKATISTPASSKIFRSNIRTFEAWAARDLSRVSYLTYLRAGRRTGARRRSYLPLPATRPSGAEYFEALKVAATEGGLQANMTYPSMYIDDPTAVSRLLSRTTDVQPVGEYMDVPTIEEQEAALEELQQIQKRLWRGKRRRYNPPWAWPIEITIMLLNPTYLTRPGQTRAGIGPQAQDYTRAYFLATVEKPLRQRRLRL